MQLYTDQGVAALAEYLFKVQDGYGIAAELVRADLKRGRRKVARVPFQIAEGAAAGRCVDLALWLEYETATKGRRIMDWTKGSTDALGMDQSDEDLAAAETGDLVYDLTAYEWSLVVRYRRRGHLLNVCDRHGRDGIDAPSPRCAGATATRPGGPPGEPGRPLGRPPRHGPRAPGLRLRPAYSCRSSAPSLSLGTRGAVLGAR